MRKQSAVWCVVLLLFVTPAYAVPVIEVDHLATQEDFATDVSIAPGQFFDVVLKHSTKSFQIKTYALRVAASASRAPAGTQGIAPVDELLGAGGAELVRSDSVRVSVAHREEYGGYVIAIDGPEHVDGFVPSVEPKKLDGIAKAFVDRMNGASWDTATLRDSARAVLAVVGTLHEMKPIKVFVRVQSPFQVAQFGAGFCATWLTDERYKSETVGTEQLLRRDGSAESKLRPLAVAFVHIQPKEKVPVALSLGLGVNGESDLSILPGVSLRFGGVMYFTAGAHIGAINVKPVGTTLNAPIQDVSVLTKPDRRFDAKPFVAFTYSFLGHAQDVLSKPFAESQK